MKKLLLLPFFCAQALHAQTFIGPELGMNTGNLKMSYPGVTYKNRLSTAFRAGLVISVNGDRNVIFHTGLCYYGKGTNLTATDGSQYYASHLVIHTLQLPVYASIQSRPGRYGRFFLGAGAFLDYHMGGNVYVGANSTKLKFGDKPGELKRLDGGLAMQAGYRVNDGISLRLQYQLGLPNLSSVLDEVIRSRSFGVTICYMDRSGVPKPPTADK
jgi:hypothetical protein